MKTLIRFLPFITFSIVSSTIGWRFGAVAGLVTLIGVVAAHRPFRVGVLSGAMGAFFAVLCVFAVVTPNLDADRWVHVAMAAWLCLVAFGSVAVGHPFTVDFSRDEVSPEAAASARFAAINRSISLRWAWVFGALAAVGAITGALDRPLIGAGAASLLLLYGIKASNPHTEAHQQPTVHSHA